MNEKNAKLESNQPLEWVEPQIRQLDVRETAYNPAVGGDGQKNYPDCTRS